jgi:hypothetical protein
LHYFIIISLFGILYFGHEYGILPASALHPNF